MELDLASKLSADEREALIRLPNCPEGRALIKAVIAFRDQELGTAKAKGRLSDVIREDVRCQIRAVTVCDWVVGLPGEAAKLEEEKGESK